MGFEDLRPAGEMPAEQQSEIGQEEALGEETSASESPDEMPVETEEGAPEPEEKSTEELLEEYWPSPEKTKKEKTGPSWGKAAIAAAALAGTLATGTEAYADMPGQLAAETEKEMTMSHENQAATQETEAKKASRTIA